MQLEEYINEHAIALSQFATSRTNPVHVPGRDECLDFSELLRAPVSGQRHVITAGVKQLNRAKGLLYVCGTGTGKTLVSAVTVHCHANNHAYRTLVFCPGQLVKKWKREIENTIPGARVSIIEHWSSLRQLHCKQPRSGSEWWIISRDRAKLGWGTHMAHWIRRGKHYCPTCGLPVEPNDKKCLRCMAKLVAANPQFNRVAPAWYIKRHLRGFFDYLILDEIHEERSADSLQGIASGQLAAACGKTIALTGTLVGGLAEHLRPLLFRLCPGSLVRAGYKWSGKADFNRDYGRYEIIETDRGTQRKLVPGIMPSMFGSHLMGKAIFLSLNEVADNLPSKREIEVPCELPCDVKDAYEECEAEIRKHMARLMRSKGMGGLGQSISFLMSYPDFPFDWQDICVRGKDGEDIVVCEPTNFDQRIVLPKEQQVVSMVHEQIDRGRKSWIYVQNTERHNVIDRLASIMTNSGIKVAVLKSSVKPEEREDWIARHGPHVDAILSHPTLVQTGLDFFAIDRTYNFPTIIFYQVGFNPFQTRQAAGRSWRIGQWDRCEVYYLHAIGTMQSRNLEVMAKKVAASMSLEGEFSSEGLLAMVGNNQDSAEAMLAKSLVDNTPVSLSRAWEKINSGKFHEDFFDSW